MEKEIIAKLKKDNKSDGIYLEKYLNNSIEIDYPLPQSIVRVILDEKDNVLVHLLDVDDNTLFMPFKHLLEAIQKEVYCDVLGYQFCDLDAFFETMCDFMDDGDILTCSYPYNEETNEYDYDTKVYTITNKGGYKIGEYSTKTKIYKKY